MFFSGEKEYDVAEICYDRTNSIETGKSGSGMFYLFLAILSSSTIAFLFKFAENREMNPYIITTANYFVATFISLFFILNNQLQQGLVKGQSFISEWQLLLASPEEPKDTEKPLPAAGEAAANTLLGFSLLIVGAILAMYDKKWRSRLNK